MTIERFDLDSIPLYNADLDTDERRPAEVVRLKQTWAAAVCAYACGSTEGVKRRSVSFENSTHKP
jgi:hypothetical protein